MLAYLLLFIVKEARKLAKNWPQNFKCKETILNSLKNLHQV